MLVSVCFDSLIWLSLPDLYERQVRLAMFCDKYVLIYIYGQYPHRLLLQYETRKRKRGEKQGKVFQDFFEMSTVKSGRGP